MRQAWIAVALLLLPALALAPSADACSVPCGRIYPLILITVEDKVAMYDLRQDDTIVVDALLTYKFDMANEGYTVATPNEPIVIRFEYPRKPDWADLKVEPEMIDVNVADPRNIQPDVSTPTSPQAQYVFTVPIKISVKLTGQAILRDGYDFHKLLVFAKSSESGLYQAGYGIKELRVVPEGALHEADVAGSRDVFTAAPLPPLELAPVETSFAGTTVTLTPPSSAKFWEPGEFVAAVSPAPTGRMVLAIHDEAGALVASTPPLAAAAEARLNATLVRPGQHTATLTLLPEAGRATPPLTYALPFAAGDLAAEGHVFPKVYQVASSETVPAPLGSEADVLAQFERDVPFFAFETAQSVSASVTLKTGGPLPTDLGRAAANLQFSIHDPDGNVLVAGSVDPSKPTASLRVGSLPVDGWYFVRVKGVGAPVGQSYDVRIEANYAAAHQARDLADGAADATGGVLPVGGANLTLPVEALAVWAPSDLTPALDSGVGMAYTITVYDANGTLAYASGAREGAASFSAMGPGVYRAFVFAEPQLRGTPFSPVVRAFTFPVGVGGTTVATTFAIDDGYEAPFGAAESLLGFHAVRVLPGAAPPTLEGAELVDAEGNAADGTTPGVYWLRASGTGGPPQGSERRVSLAQSYASAVTLESPGPAAPPANGLPIPAPAFAYALIAAGIAAIAIAFARRR